MIIIGESRATRTGLHHPPLCLQNRNCVSNQSYVKWCIVHALRQKTRSVIISGSDFDHWQMKLYGTIFQSAEVWFLAIGTCNWLGFGENNSNFRVAGEKNQNHIIIRSTESAGLWHWHQLDTQHIIGSCTVKPNCQVIGHTRGRSWAASCAIRKLERFRTDTKRTFLNCLRELKETMLDIFTPSLLFHHVHDGLELWCLNPIASGAFKTSEWACPISSTRILPSRW